jgi:uncharacterized damage-inducible protein DinB
MLAQLVPELDRIEPRTRVAVTGLPESKFHELPPEGGWSIAQVFEHLCLTNLAYLDGPLPGAIEKARARGPSEKPWRSSLAGGWLAGALARARSRCPRSSHGASPARRGRTWWTRSSPASSACAPRCSRPTATTWVSASPRPPRRSSA